MKPYAIYKLHVSCSNGFCEQNQIKFIWIEWIWYSVLTASATITYIKHAKRQNGDFPYIDIKHTHCYTYQHSYHYSFRVFNCSWIINPIIELLKQSYTWYSIEDLFNVRTCLNNKFIFLIICNSGGNAVCQVSENVECWHHRQYSKITEVNNLHNLIET